MAIASLEREVVEAVNNQPYVHWEEALPDNYSVRRHGRIALRPNTNPNVTEEEVSKTKPPKSSLIRISLRKRVVFVTLLATAFANFD